MHHSDRDIHKAGFTCGQSHKVHKDTINGLQLVFTCAKVTALVWVLITVAKAFI